MLLSSMRQMNSLLRPNKKTRHISSEFQLEKRRDLAPLPILDPFIDVYHVDSFYQLLWLRTFIGVWSHQAGLENRIAFVQPRKLYNQWNHIGYMESSAFHISYFPVCWYFCRCGTLIFVRAKIKNKNLLFEESSSRYSFQVSNYCERHLATGANKNMQFLDSWNCAGNPFLVYRGENYRKALWVPKVILFFEAYVRRNKIEEEPPFIQYDKFSWPMDETKQMFGCACLRWSTKEGMVHTMKPGIFRKKWKNLMIGWWFGVELFSSFQGIVHVGLFNDGISRFSYCLHWPQQRFYINRFFREESHES